MGKYNIKKNGYLIAEAIIAISVPLMGILSILGFISRSINVNRIISDQFTANYLAMEGIEVVKNIIDANVIACLDGASPWNEGFTSSGSFEVDYNSAALESNQNRQLSFDSNSGRYSYDSGEPSRFTRTIYIDPIGSDEIKVNSIVEWTTRGGGSRSIDLRSIDLEDHFFNWLCDN